MAAEDNQRQLCHLFTRETRMKTSTEPDVVEYDIAYGYDQLGNRTVRTDHVAERRTDYVYDTDMDPNQLTHATRENRLLSYKLYDTSAVALLRPSGFPRVSLDGGEQECGLSLFGDTDTELVSLRTAPGESSALKMSSAEGKQRVLLGTETKGTRTGLYLSDVHGVKRASVSIETESDFGFGTWGADGKPIWKH
jgi:hypothetical protein